MNVLIVSSYLPYPLFSGGHIRLYNLIKELSSKHKITLICEKRNYQGAAEINELKKFCKKVITVARKKQWSLGNVLRTGLSTLPFLVIGHTNSEMHREIQRELNENQFDLIHAETSYIMQNIPLTKVPIILIEHNVEYLVYKRFADKAPLLLKPLLYIDILKLKYWEEKVWTEVTKLIAVSKIEQKIMNKIRKDVIVVPNGEVATPTGSYSTNTSGSTAVSYDGYYIKPVRGVRTQGIHGYNAVDIGAPHGTPIVAAASGKVIICSY